jgi:hypothetical protein
VLHGAYLTARQKGIAIYSFVEQGLERLIPIWRQNPAVNLSPQVENPRVLEFIDQIRNVHKVWMQEFRTPHDIIGMLRTQFAYLFEEGLRLRQQVRAGTGATWLEDLHGNALPRWTVETRQFVDSAKPAISPGRPRPVSSTSFRSPRANPSAASSASFAARI